MQQKRCGPSFFLLLCFSLSSAGCSGISTPGPPDLDPKPLAGSSLRVSCPDDFTKAIVTEASLGWRKREGLNKFTGDVAETPDEQADVWVLPASQLGRWTGKLAPLPPEMTERDGSFDWTDLLPAYSEKLLRWNGTAL